VRKRFFLNAGLIAAAEIVIRLKSFLFIPLLTRRFGPVDYGAWSQVSILAATLAPAVVLGTDAALMRFLPGAAPETQKRWFTAWSILVGSLLVFLYLVIVILRGPLAITFFGSRELYAPFVALAGASLLISVILNGERLWFRIQHDAATYALSTVSQAALEVGALAAILMARQGAYELVLYTLMADLPIVIWLAWSIARRFGWGHPDFSILKPLLTYGLPLVPAGYAMWSLNSIDRVFLVRYGTLADVGVYAFNYSVAYLVIQILVTPIWVMYPSMAADLYQQRKFDEQQRLLRDSMRLIFALTLPALTGLAVLSRPLLTLVGTSVFATAASSTTFISVGYLLHMIASYYDIELGLVGKQYWSTLSIGIACLTNIVLNFVLIPRYRIVGAAIATMIGFATQFLISLALAWHFAGARFPYRNALRVAAACAVMAVSVSAVRESVTLGLMPTVVLSVVTGVVVYGALLIPLGIVDSTFVNEVTALVRRGRMTTP
jgi:O-antigen/teichoic acid export membrane protein